MPKLSIITVNYNNKAGLEKTIKSVITQTYKDFEYIVVDGGSTDGSVDVIRQYGDKIIWWVSEKDTGIYNAMNKGIRKATGEYCLFLNSGDYLIDDAVLSKVFHDKRQEDIICCEIVFDYSDGKQKIGKFPQVITTEYLFHNSIWHPGAFIKRKLFEQIGFYNEAYKIAADYDFFFHAITVNEVSWKIFHFPVTVYETNGASMNSENMPQIIAEHAAIHSKYLEQPDITFYKNLGKIRSKVLAKWLIDKPMLTRVVFKLSDMFKKLNPGKN